MNKLLKLTTISVLAASLVGCGVSPDAEKVVNVYSERHYDVDQLIYDEFEKETGIKVNIIQSSGDDLITRMKNEGADTAADMLIVADAGRLERAKSEDLLQTFSTSTLRNNIPSNLRDDQEYWYGLTKRARVIVYSKERVNPNQLSTYEDLATSKWQGKLVLRTSTNIYNQSFMSAYYAINGEAKSRELIAGFVNNLAQDPRGNDRDQAKFIAAGIADVTIMNTYYLGRMLTSTDTAEKDAATKVGVFFPNQTTTGTHVNVSGAGISKYAKHKNNAILLIEHLSSIKAQGEFANVNYEYPVNPNVEPNELLKSWGEFKTQDVNLSVLGQYSSIATLLMNEGGWK